MLLLTKKHTDTLIEQLKSRPQKHLILDEISKWKRFHLPFQ